MTEDVRSLWAMSLITVGGLVTALCGSCTVYFVGIAIFALIDGGYDATFASLVLMLAAPIGGIPTMIGVLLLRAGLRRQRRVSGDNR